MKIYDETKTFLLNKDELNLEEGYLKDDKLIIHHNKIEGKEEKGHYETIIEYENGGKDVEWIVDEEGIKEQDAHDEEIEIQVYVKYSDEELKQMQIEKQKIEIESEIYDLKLKLDQTDYKAIKYFEGWYTAEEYKPTLDYRESLRKQIRQLEKYLKSIGE